MATETLTYTNPATGASITFGDTSLPNVVYNGITGIGMAPVDNFVVDTAYQPGAVFVRTKKKPTVLTAHLVVQGAVSAGVNARVSLFQTADQVLGVLEPQIEQAGTLVKMLADGTQRMLKNAQYVGGFEMQDQAANWAYIPLDLIFEAYDPTWYSVATHQTVLGASSDIYGFNIPFQLPLTVSGQATGSVTVVNSGNIDAHPLFTFNGPCSNYTVLNQTTGESFTGTQVLNTGDTLVIDTNLGSLSYTPSGGVPTPLYSAFGGSKQWVRLVPGNNLLTFSRDVSGNNQCVVSWQDSWNHG